MMDSFLHEMYVQKHWDKMLNLLIACVANIFFGGFNQLVGENSITSFLIKWITIDSKVVYYGYIVVQIW